MPPNRQCATSCCTVDCTECTDDFIRADDTNISTGSTCGWTEVVGSWEISGNALTTTSTNAYVRCNTAHSGGISSAVVTEYCQGSSGDELDLILNLSNSTKDNAWIARYVVDGCIIIGQVVSGSFVEKTRISGGPIADEPSTLKAYFGNGFIHAEIDGTVVLSYEATATSGNSYVGLGTGAQASGIVFSTFTFERYGEGDDAGDCPVATHNCTIKTDDFERSDIGCNYTVSGTYSIDTGRLEGTGGGYVECLTANPEGSPTGLVSATVNLPTNGDTVQLQLADGQIVAQIEAVGLNRKVSFGGSLSATGNFGNSFSLCFNGDQATIYAGSTTLLGADYSSVTTGSKARLKVVTNVSGNAGFESFAYYGYDIAGDCPACDEGPQGCCTAPGDLMMDYMEVTISGATGSDCCDALNGTYVLDPYITDADSGTSGPVVDGCKCGPTSGIGNTTYVYNSIAAVFSTFCAFKYTLADCCWNDEGAGDLAYDTDILGIIGTIGGDLVIEVWVFRWIPDGTGANLCTIAALQAWGNYVDTIGPKCSDIVDGELDALITDDICPSPNNGTCTVTAGYV